MSKSGKSTVLIKKGGTENLFNLIQCYIYLFRGGRKTTTWRNNNKFMIQEETENIREWQVYSSS